MHSKVFEPTNKEDIVSPDPELQSEIVFPYRSADPDSGEPPRDPFARPKGHFFLFFQCVTQILSTLLPEVLDIWEYE